MPPLPISLFPLQWAAKGFQTMLIEEVVLEKLRGLPPTQQQEVLDFVEFLEYRQHLSFEAVVQRIRERAAAYEAGEIDTLVEEARDDFYRQQQSNYAG